MSEDTIEIRALRVLGHHGALPGEQDRAQPFEIDLSLGYSMDAAAKSDDLRDAVDYGAVARSVSEVVATRRFSLLEALADAVALEVLEDQRVDSVTVTLRKLRPPVPEHVESIGVVRTRLALVVARAALGLGSNLGDRWAYLANALKAIRAREPSAVVSSVYQTDPVGGPEGQGPYLNCVVVLDSVRRPQELLALGQQLETQAACVRLERFGPRTLDVDVLYVEGVESDDPLLTLPHPRMHERAFVLAPLEEIAPELVPLGWRARLGGEEVVSNAVQAVGALLMTTTERRR